MNILLGVCGSISAYRALDICRGFAKANHRTRVVLTRGALEFVRPEVFKYLGAEEVYLPTDDFNPQKLREGSVLHIDLAKWADRAVLAPASANTLAKLAGGMCDDLLSSVFLAAPSLPFIIYPAMNTNMLAHPLTRSNLNKLDALENVSLLPTKQGLLACGDEGAGKLQDVDMILETALIIEKSRTGRKVLISAGPTIAPLDPVRYLTNPSSGTTGYELAKFYLSRGDEVCLVAGRGATAKVDYLEALPSAEVVRAQTTEEMRQAVLERFAESELYISSAAPCDIQFEQSSVKLKKNAMEAALPISRAPDILREALEQKRPDQQVVGFAAETNGELETFEKKWKDKPVDVLVGNVVSSGVGGPARGFGQDSNEYTLLKKGKLFYNGELSKVDLAKKIDEALRK